MDIRAILQKIIVIWSETDSRSYLSVTSTRTGLDSSVSFVATSFIFKELHFEARSINVMASIIWYILLPTMERGRNGAPLSMSFFMPQHSNDVLYFIECISPLSLSKRRYIILSKVESGELLGIIITFKMKNLLHPA